MGNLSIAVPLSGHWQNSYGSTLDLSVSENGNLIGKYASTTGASGTYPVLGQCQTNASGSGIGLVLGISWRALDDTKTTPTYNNTWHWVSTYCGQLTTSGNLSVINSLVGTTAFGDTSKGDYVDKLSFDRLSDADAFDQSWACAGDKVDNLLNGYWLLPSGDCALELEVVSDYGLVQGKVVFANKSYLAVQGFTDTQTPLSGETPWRQSVTFNVCSGTQILSFSGYLDISLNQLILTCWQAYGTAPGDEYLQASATAYNFVR